MTQVVIADLRTGRKIVDLPFKTLSWQKTRNTAETIRCGVPLSSRMVRQLDLINATSPAKSMIAVIENETVMAAGPIWRRQFNDATNSLTLSGAGLWSYFDHRQIVPLLADSVNVIDPATGQSLTASNTVLSNLSYGTMAKRLIQQSMLWTGGNLPITFLDDELGTYTKTYLGANLTQIGEALRNLTGLVNGVDIEFLGRRTADRKGLEFLLRTGTLAQPELHGNTTHVWDLSVPQPSIRNLETSDDASEMTGQAWTTGGRQDGTAVVERAMNASLTSFGYPLLESVDSSHADVSESDTLLRYSSNAILLGSAPENAWTFEAKADAAPVVGTYAVGDYASIKIRKNHPWLEEGPHVREIASLSGDQDGTWVKVTTQEVISA